MRPALFLFVALFALAGIAADEPKPAPAKKAPKAGKGAEVLPDSVSGVSEEEYAKIRRALILTYGDPQITAARKRLAELKERTRFTAGKQEAEDLRLDFNKAGDEMVKAKLDAVLKLDPTISKDSLVLTLNAVDEGIKKRSQEAALKAREKEAAEAKARAKEAPETKPEAPAAKPEEAKPLTPAQILADVEGVSAEDMKKFRAAAPAAQKDPAVRELKAKQAELRKQAEFASVDEKKGMRGEFEAIMADVHKATLAAILKAQPTLAKETAERILETVEARIIAANQKNAKKPTKTPLKPFPFAEKK
jgi:hypothetical protein